MYSLCLLAIQKYLSLARCKFQGTANVSCVFFPVNLKYVVGLFLNMTLQMHIQYAAPLHTACSQQSVQWAAKVAFIHLI